MCTEPSGCAAALTKTPLLAPRIASDVCIMTGVPAPAAEKTARIQSSVGPSRASIITASMSACLWRAYVTGLSDSIPFPYGSFLVYTYADTPRKRDIVLGVKIALCGDRDTDLHLLRYHVEEYGRPYGVIVDDSLSVQFFNLLDDDDSE
jgi:hypothetical protein